MRGFVREALRSMRIASGWNGQELEGQEATMDVVGRMRKVEGRGRRAVRCNRAYAMLKRV